MKIYLNAYTDKPGTEYLDDIWGFITGRTSVNEFEAFIYGHSDKLKDLFNESTVLYLLEFPYKTGNISSLRLDLKTAVEALPTRCRCECIKIPDEAWIKVGFLYRLEDSGTVIDYVNDEIMKTFDKVAADESLNGYWQSVKDGVRAVKEYFSVEFYECRECDRTWAISSNDCGDYIFKRIERSQILDPSIIRNALHFEKVD